MIACHYRRWFQGFSICAFRVLYYSKLSGRDRRRKVASSRGPSLPMLPPEASFARRGRGLDRDANTPASARVRAADCVLARNNQGL
jgi:hypothetical protein